MSVVAFVWSIFAAGVVGIMWLLAVKEDRRRVGYWCALGIALAVVKMIGIQMLPQWRDTPLDSITFQIHAEAMLLNWQGLPVNTSDYRLQIGPLWLPEARFAYVGAMGTYEWLYSAFLAGWKFMGEEWLTWAAMGNAAMAGAFPAASFILVRLLRGSVGVAHLGAVLVALEPSAAVNSAWLIKDTLAGFVALLVAITLCRLYARPSWACIFALALAMGMLAGIRFVAYVAYIGAVLGLCLWLLRQKAWHKLAAFSLAAALSVGVFVLIYAAPLSPSFEQWTNALRGPVQAQIHILIADDVKKGADESVIVWRDYLREQPGWAIARSVARTLMAPYPWVAFTYGLSGNNHLELYLPGTAFWILCLPAIFAGMVVALGRERVMTAVLLFYLVLLAGAYITYFGEWSTRQRIFMIPLFFAFAAIGWERLWNWLRGRYRYRTATEADTSAANRK